MRNNFLTPFIIFFLGIVSVVLIYPINNGLPGDLGDARFNLYVLEHFYLAIIGQVENFVDGGFFYPLTKTMLFSGNHWGTGLIYSYFRLFDASPIESFFYWFLVGFILNYWLSFYVLRKFELSELAAAIGAFLFTFGLPVIAQDGHAQMIYRPFVPLAFLAFFHYAKSRNLYHLSLVALTISLQLLISVYSGLFLLFSLAVWALIEISMVSKNGIKNKIKFFLPSEFELKKSLPLFALSLAAFLLFVIPYFEVKNLYHLKRYIVEIAIMIPRIPSYFLADRSHLWFHDFDLFSSIEARWEHQMFIGIGAFLALIFLYFRKGLIEKKSLAHKFSLLLLVMIIATLSIAGFSLYYLLMPIPGVSSVRSVSREILVMLFPIAYLVGFSIDKIRRTDFKNLSSTALVSLICALILIDPILADKSISPIKDWKEREELAELKIKSFDESSIIVIKAADIHDEIDMMLLAQKLGVRTLNGYSGIFPKQHWYLIDSCDKAKARLEDIEEVMRETNQNYQINRSKIVAIGFDEKCDFTTSR